MAKLREEHVRIAREMVAREVPVRRGAADGRRERASAATPQYRSGDL